MAKSISVVVGDSEMTRVGRFKMRTGPYWVRIVTGKLAARGLAVAGASGLAGRADADDAVAGTPIARAAAMASAAIRDARCRCTEILLPSEWVASTARTNGPDRTNRPSSRAVCQAIWLGLTALQLRDSAGLSPDFADWSVEPPYTRRTRALLSRRKTVRATPR
jgi:hypothetical protein